MLCKSQIVDFYISIISTEQLKKKVLMCFPSSHWPYLSIPKKRHLAGCAVFGPLIVFSLQRSWRGGRTNNPTIQEQACNSRGKGMCCWPGGKKAAARETERGGRNGMKLVISRSVGEGGWGFGHLSERKKYFFFLWMLKKAFLKRYRKINSRKKKNISWSFVVGGTLTICIVTTTAMQTDKNVMQRRFPWAKSLLCVKELNSRNAHVSIHSATNNSLFLIVQWLPSVAF